MIYICRPKLPKLSEYNKYLKRIWQTNWMTNNGPLLQELEEKLKEYWGVKHVICVNNGTAATMVALKALDIKDKVYVSANSYISTVSAPLFMGIKPIFQDIDEEVKGPAIITHLYGVPNIVKAKPVIYDACHAFPIRYKGKSIFNYGDIVITSFHATKVFQAIEGGAVVTNNDKLAEKARRIRNFGWKDTYKSDGIGVNFKMSEFHAAMGLCMLPKIEKMFNRLQEITQMYNKALGFNNQDMTYYPIWYDSEKKVLKAIEEFGKHQIYPRRYFYPPLNKIYKGKACPKAENLMKRVLCLPLFYDLKTKDIKKIIKIVKATL